MDIWPLASGYALGRLGLPGAGRRCPASREGASEKPWENTWDVKKITIQPHQNIYFRGEMMISHSKHTVGGRNPAPPWMVETLSIMG